MQLHPRRRITCVAVGLVLVLGASCSKDGGPSTPRFPTISDIELTGPRSVAPGATAQFKLTARWTNGAAQDVTREAVWTSSNPTAASVVAGLAAGQNVGESNIAARYAPSNGAPLSRSTELIVVPQGTFRVTGRVSETLLGRPVASAQLTVLTGKGAGQTATSLTDGRYRLYGLVDQTGIEAKKAGYQDDVRQVVVNEHDQAIDFVLGSGSLEAVEGTFTLTITASANCRDRLREDLRVRTYTAQVTRSGRDLSVTLSGATFFSTYNRFIGTVEADGRIRFTLADPYDYYYSSSNTVIEQIGTIRLTIWGSVVGHVSSSGIVGTLNGSIWHQPSSAFCNAVNHGFELRSLQ